MGVGRSTDTSQDLAAYVLERYSKDEQEILMKQLQGCEDSLAIFIKEGLQKAQMKAAELS